MRTLCGLVAGDTEHLRVSLMIDYVIKSAVVVGLEKIIFIDLDGPRKAIEEVGDPELSLELSERRYCA